MKYETLGGQVTKGETFAKLLHHLREAQDCCAVLSHLCGMNGEKLIAHGWMGIQELLKRTIHTVTTLATRGLQ